jgi:hypothetical protein
MVPAKGVRNIHKLKEDEAKYNLQSCRIVQDEVCPTLIEDFTLSAILPNFNESKL